MAYLLGIDLGGTKIEGVVIKEGNFLDVVARKRVPTEKEKGYEHIKQNIKNLVRALEEEVDYTFEKIGIGTPGSIDAKTGLLKNSNATCVNGKPFQKELSEEMGKDVRMANDANCFAMAETMLGSVQEHAPDAKVVFGVIMGTGVGGGIVINGQILNGLHGIGGEWGHMHLDDSGGMCYCGNVGCAETVISGPFTEKWYEQISGKKMGLKEIVQHYRAGDDVHAKLTMERLFDRFGRGIASILNFLDPDVVVLGGGVGNVDELYTLGVEKVKEYLFNDYMNTKFLRPKLGDSAGVYGAALL
ncbi:ROK family protein [Portibacter lacus]|uniref:Sugar kinase n=1 Tax=Portibacter lacus TaxID=1099794 RepID=A0AA37SRL7_9BACT|nr:ROK family protein [Portibacter lacus]GLR18505.1 sugar kinase [Portibacter lacus]